MNIHKNVNRNRSYADYHQPEFCELEEGWTFLFQFMKCFFIILISINIIYVLSLLQISVVFFFISFMYLFYSFILFYYFYYIQLLLFVLNMGYFKCI